MVGLAVLLAMAGAGVFLVQPEILRHLSQSGQQQQLRHSGQGV